MSIKFAGEGNKICTINTEALYLHPNSRGWASPSFLFIQEMKQADILKAAAEEYAQANGLFVVSVEISKDNDVDVTIDADDRDVTLDDCVGMTGYIQERVDRDVEDYALTIGSAGLSSPFKVVRQWKKAVGTEIQLTRLTGERIKANLLSADDEGVEISWQKKAEGKGSKAKETVTEHLSYNEIKTAKPIIKF